MQRIPTVGIAGLTTIGLAIAGFTACGKYEAPQDTDAFHANFDWGPAHEPAASVDDTDQEVFEANNFCDKCHIASVPRQIQCDARSIPENQGDEPPPVTIDDPATGWATILAPRCQDCHPLIPLGQDPATFPCEPTQYLACDPNDQSEYCRYINSGAHNPSNVAGGCGGGGGCHTTTPATDWSAGGGGPGEPAGHDDPPTSQTFPLDGGHAGLQCTDCHADLANTANEAGQAAFCGNCHSREGEGRDLEHYPPDRLGWTDERERDCKACHATVSVGAEPVTLQMPSSWAEIANNHSFRAPHYTVQDWDVDPVVATQPTDWRNDCTSCHDVGSVTTGVTYIDPSDGRFSCGSCHDLAQLDADYPAFHNDLANNPSGCNNAACHPSGTVEGENEPSP